MSENKHFMAFVQRSVILLHKAESQTAGGKSSVRALLRRAPRSLMLSRCVKD